MNLAEKYRPQRIADFIGLDVPKKVLRGYVENASGRAWFFSGRTGSGKSAMALALAAELKAQVHLLPAAACTPENVASVEASCTYQPAEGFVRHLVLTDQADTLSVTRQNNLRSRLEPLQPHSTVWVLTGLSTQVLDSGFVSRCMVLNFSTYGSAPAAAAFLERVWNAEVQPGQQAPNCARIIKEAKGDLRAALGELENRLASAQKSAPHPGPVTQLHPRCCP